MNQTLKDIHWMLLEIWMSYDGVGADAFDEPIFKTMAEKYGFFCEDSDMALEMLKRLKSEVADSE